MGDESPIYGCYAVLSHDALGTSHVGTVSAAMRVARRWYGNEEDDNEIPHQHGFTLIGIVALLLN